MELANDRPATRTLVVEDEPATRHLLREILQGRGHEVEACADAETAWASYQRERHSLVVLDWQLPGMDGIELCRRIRSVPESRDTFILFLTAVEQRDSLQKALQAGASDYLGKSHMADQIDIRLAIAERHVRRTLEGRLREEELIQDALHDPLTDLPNRTLFNERLDQAARRASRRISHLFSVLVVDLHEFRRVNEAYGRGVADEVLKEVSARLADCIRGVDTLARLGSDDFGILLDGLTDVSDPTRVAHRVHQAFSVPVRVGQEEVFVSACIGISLSVTGFDRPEQLVADAQKALLKAKGEGGGSHQMYDPVIHARAMARVRLEGRIEKAIAEDDLVLHYQPLVDLPTGRVRSVEALVRWQDEERGVVMPAEFIPVAEATGLILPLGSWVLLEAVRQAAEWRERFGGDAPAVTVNVSGKQLAGTGLIDEITSQLEDRGLPGEALHVEITETSLMRDVESTTRLLRQLKESAVRLHVDDFGTGYSSLSYLCRFPIDALKIDRSFVTQMTHSAENLEVVRTIVRLGRNLGMEVIAEGVETEAQLDLLRDMEVQAVQGYLFSRAVPPLELDAMLVGGVPL